MRELSRLVASTAREDDFGAIRLTVGESEMEVDGMTQPITDDENIVPFVDENDELQIPVGVIDEADPNGSGFLSEDELEERGYAVSFDADTGNVRITEPYQQCRLIVRTADGKVDRTFGAVQSLAVSDQCIVLQYTDKNAAANAAAQLRADPSILSCTADRLVSLDASANALSETVPEQLCRGTKRSGADEWMASHAGDDLEQVIVAVIDTGVQADHPFLQGRVLSGGWDFVNDDDDPADDHAHGTHCAGIIRDATLDNVRILPVKILSAEGTGDLAVVREAMRWAADQGVDVFSMSFGAYPEESGLEDPEEIEEWLREDTAAIQYAYDAGVTCVAAAGNESDDLDVVPHSPAGLPHVITVASIDEKDTPSTFSNYGSKVDVCAPGENIVSSVSNVSNCLYQAMSGTSMAAPLVAAVCANFLSEDKTRTPDDVLDCVTAHAEDVGLPGRDDYCGAGCVSMRAHTAVRGIALPHETMRMNARAQYRLCPVFSPQNASNRTVTFTSSDPSVVTVDDYGNIFTKKRGAAVISVVSTDGGFTAQCAITVLGSSGARAVQASPNDLFMQRTDGTMQYSGFAIPRLGNGWSEYLDGTWGTVYGPDREPISGITEFWMIPYIKYTFGSDNSLINPSSNQICAYYAKEDGLLREISEEGESIIQKKADGTPLSGVTDIQKAGGNIFALDETGTIYANRTGDNNWQCVRKEDGTVLQNVRKIGMHAAFCEDGSVWFITRETAKNNDCTFAVPYTPIPEAVDGFILMKEKTNSETQPFAAVLLLADGTVRVVGDNTLNFLGVPEAESIDMPTLLTLEDGQPLCGVCALHFTGSGVYALREDGSVFAWGATSAQHGMLESYTGYLGVGESEDKRACPMPVVLEDGTPLTGVRTLADAYGARMLFLREDNSVWICGIIGPKSLSSIASTTVVHRYAAPLTFQGDPLVLLDIPMEPCETTVPARSVSLKVDRIYIGVGDTFPLQAIVLPANADNRDVVFSCSTCSFGCPVAQVSSDGVVVGLTEGTITVTASAADAPNVVTARCTVTVGPAKAKSVFVSNLPDKTVYDRGEPLDTTGGTLRIRLANNETGSVPLPAQLCRFDPLRTGWQRVMVDYNGLTASFSVFVRPRAAVSITLTEPDKTDYLRGEALDLTGGAVTVHYSDGSQLTVPLTGEMCSPFDSSEADSVQTITVTWSGLTASFNVNVHMPRVCGIRMFELPQKQDYDAGETQPDPTGGSVVYLYEDGTEGDVVPLTAQMCGTSAFTRLGEQTVPVSLDGFTTSFTVCVHAIEGATLSMQTMPVCLYYAFSPNQKIDPRGGSVCLQYPDGTVKVAAITQDMCSLPDSSINAASWEITVTYMELTTTFSIYNIKKPTVRNFDVDHIGMQRLPDQTEVYSGQDPDLTGGVVRVYGADGQYLDASLTGASIRVVGDLNEIGLHKVKVTLCSCTTQFYITVLPLPAAEYWLVQTPDQTVYCLGEESTINLYGGIYAAKWYIIKDGSETVTEKSFSSINSSLFTGFDPLQAGEQTITANSTDGAVLFTFPVYVTDFTLQSDVTRLQLGQSTSFRAVYRYPIETEPKITWTSSDTSVATVDGQGNVKSVGVGTAEITAKVNDHCTAACTITVQAEAVEPDGLVFVQAPTELTAGDMMQFLTAAMPINAVARPITWTSSDPSVLSVDETGVVTAIREGTAQITAQVRDNDAAVSCTVTVSTRTTVHTIGDSDSDNSITLKDVVRIARYLAGGWDAPIDLVCADVNYDGTIDLKDVVILRRYLAGGWSISL